MSTSLASELRLYRYDNPNIDWDTWGHVIVAARSRTEACDIMNNAKDEGYPSVVPSDLTELFILEPGVISHEFIRG
jgi:hypothetical protein